MPAVRHVTAYVALRIRQYERPGFMCINVNGAIKGRVYENALSLKNDNDTRHRNSELITL